MNIKFLVIIFSLFLFSSVHFSQTINFDRIIDDIQFKGLSSDLAKEAIHSLDLQTSTKTLLSSKQLKHDLNSIFKTGYFSHVTIDTAIIDTQYILFFQVHENLLINDIKIIAKSNRIKQLIYDSFSSLLSTPINSLILERLKNETIITIKDAGFDFFDLTDIVFDKPSQTLRIVAHEAMIEDINFSGLENINPSILFREMSQTKNVIFNSLNLRKDRERLIRLGYFNSISSPQFSQGSSPDLIKVHFNVIEKKLNKISIGLEQDDLLYYGFISTRRHNLLINSDLASFKTQLQLAESAINFDRYSLGYNQPWLFNRYNVAGSIKFYNLEKQEFFNNQTTRSLRQGQQIGITIPFSDFFSLNSSLKFENVSRLFETDTISPYSIHSYEMVMLFNTIRYSMNPKQGVRLYFNIEQGNHLGLINIGGLSFTRLSSSASYFYSLNSKLVLASRIKGGIFYPIQEAINTFENEYFILGGSRSIRGYNEADSPFSGRRHLLMNLELRYFLSSNLQSIIFIDSGNAFNNRLLPSHFQTGYGIGIRYHTPIGPIRVDFAQGESYFYIHFGLGHTF